MKGHPLLALRFVWLFLVFPCPLAAEEATVRYTLQGHTKAVVCVAISPDGKTLATASADQKSKTVLESLAAGAKGFNLTREAQASLDRLDKRNAANP
jgi:WD40 repeat protein